MYTYGDLTDDIAYLTRYGFETGSIGNSRYGRPIPYVKLKGKGGDALLITAGIHAREHVSSLFAVKQLFKMSVSRLGCNIYIVPMVNPDGNVLVQYGADAFGADRERLLALNGQNPDFSLWKASAAGVDLNVNFDARWGTGTHNTRTAGSENYIGAEAFSEPETRALAAFTRAVKPSLTLSYHAKGREVYYAFGQNEKDMARDKRIAEYAASLTGYTPVDGTRGSAGGYKDWCISALGIPSLTVELVADDWQHPLPDTAIAEDYAHEPLLPLKLYAFMQENGFAAKR